MITIIYMTLRVKALVQKGSEYHDTGTSAVEQKLTLTHTAIKCYTRNY